VHHGAPPLPDVVEGEDLLHPPRPGESLGFLFDQDRAGCDDQGVVAQFGAVSQMHDVRLDVDALNWTRRNSIPLWSWCRRERTISVLCVNPNGTKSNPGW